MAAARLVQSLERAVSSPPPRLTALAGSPSRGTGDVKWAQISAPTISSPSWKRGLDKRCVKARSSKIWEYDQAASSGSASACSSSSSVSSANAQMAVPSNWSSAVPLPRLALLSGLTTLRLNVSLDGVQARVSSKGLLGDSSQGDDNNGKRHEAGFDQDPKKYSGRPRKTCHFPKKTCKSSARTERARRCIRRVARQLMERIHPASASVGYWQACRLFRDEMKLLAFKKNTQDDVLQALLEMTARLRDPAAGQEENMHDNQAFSPPLPPPLNLGKDQGVAVEMPEMPNEVSMSGERDEVRHLVESGMVVLSNAPAFDGGDDSANGGSDRQDDSKQMVLDIVSVEVGCTRQK